MKQPKAVFFWAYDLSEYERKCYNLDNKKGGVTYEKNTLYRWITS